VNEGRLNLLIPSNDLERSLDGVLASAAFVDVVSELMLCSLGTKARGGGSAKGVCHRVGEPRPRGEEGRGIAMDKCFIPRRAVGLIAGLGDSNAVSGSDAGEDCRCSGGLYAISVNDSGASLLLSSLSAERADSEASLLPKLDLPDLPMGEKGLKLKNGESAPPLACALDCREML
jgi:hypothetical protein